MLLFLFSCCIYFELALYILEALKRFVRSAILQSDSVERLFGICDFPLLLLVFSSMPISSDWAAINGYLLQSTSYKLLTCMLES